MSQQAVKMTSPLPTISRIIADAYDVAAGGCSGRIQAKSDAFFARPQPNNQHLVETTPAEAR